MRYKDTIKTAKKAQKQAKRHPDLYSREELMYIDMMKRAAQESLKHKKEMKKEMKSSNEC